MIHSRGGTLAVKLAYSMRRRRTSGRMTRWILLISFFILFARLVFATLGAWHYQLNDIEKIAHPVEQIRNIGDRDNN
ncbi:YfgG family protein [Acerihabitans sp. TG2]|uniref:YfgG family protein n=1 Tax=Acerihabitans sp. TG2 TaxID=3096008 RepID=UPI002B2283E6|nr:YfgG family protein [Acerihabitans sp. TG2]MEA9388994.1 YfgG family protein [Acerihabitans sp. TG2]